MFNQVNMSTYTVEKMNAYKTYTASAYIYKTQDCTSKLDQPTKQSYTSFTDLKEKTYRTMDSVMQTC